MDLSQYKSTVEFKPVRDAAELPTGMLSNGDGVKFDIYEADSWGGFIAVNASGYPKGLSDEVRSCLDDVVAPMLKKGHMYAVVWVKFSQGGYACIWHHGDSDAYNNLLERYKGVGDVIELVESMGANDLDYAGQDWIVLRVPEPSVTKTDFYQPHVQGFDVFSDAVLSCYYDIRA